VPDLSDLDPSSHGGFKVLFAREVPLEMRLQTSEAAPAEAGALEAVLCKVCVREGDGGRPSAVKVELSSEGDLFFHYSHVRVVHARQQRRRAPVGAAAAHVSGSASAAGVAASGLARAARPLRAPHASLASPAAGRRSSTSGRLPPCARSRS